jgi:transcriptional regulator with PAS, ATPase and Fis domain
MQIAVPALRVRYNDIELLIRVFYDRFVKSLNKSYFPIPKDYLDALREYSFPGNVRELQNIIERSVNLSKDGRLDISFLPQDITASYNSKTIIEHEGLDINEEEKPSARKYLKDYEKKIIQKLLKEYGGNISKVSKELGMTRSTLYRKMGKYGILKQVDIIEKVY